MKPLLKHKHKVNCISHKSRIFDSDITRTALIELTKNILFYIYVIIIVSIEIVILMI